MIAAWGDTWGGIECQCLGVSSPHLPCDISEANVRGNFNGSPPDSRRLSIHFGRFSVIFSLYHTSQFQSASVNCNQSQ